jgi:hypothetical protein
MYPIQFGFNSGLKKKDIV